LISGNSVKIPVYPEIGAIKVSAERGEDDPVGKKKADRDPWEILQIEVRSYWDHNNSL
jgi:hypothetical protein